MLSLERAAELNGTMVRDEHLVIHAKNVSYAMGAMAEHFGENVVVFLCSPERYQKKITR